MRRIILGLVTGAAVALAPLTASAAFITGSFEGIAHTTRYIPQYNAPSITVEFDAPVTGNFGFETDITSPSTSLREPEFYPGSAAYFGLNTLLEFTLEGDTNTFTNGIDGYGGPRLGLGDNGERQRLILDISGPYWYSHIDFVGLDGTMFQNLDPLTFNPSGIDLAASSAQFSGDIRSGGSSVRFTQLAFDGYPTAPVPSPATGGLLLIGVMGLFAARRLPAKPHA